MFTVSMKHFNISLLTTICPRIAFAPHQFPFLMSVINCIVINCHYYVSIDRSFVSALAHADKEKLFNALLKANYYVRRASV